MNISDLMFFFTQLEILFSSFEAANTVERMNQAVQNLGFGYSFSDNKTVGS